MIDDILTPGLTRIPCLPSSQCITHPNTFSIRADRPLLVLEPTKDINPTASYPALRLLAPGDSKAGTQQASIVSLAPPSISLKIRLIGKKRDLIPSNTLCPIKAASCPQDIDISSTSSWLRHFKLSGAVLTATLDRLAVQAH